MNKKTKKENKEMEQTNNNNKNKMAKVNKKNQRTKDKNNNIKWTRRNIQIIKEGRNVTLPSQMRSHEEPWGEEPWWAIRTQEQEGQGIISKWTRRITQMIKRREGRAAERTMDCLALNLIHLIHLVHLILSIFVPKMYALKEPFKSSDSPGSPGSPDPLI
jgi:hypothetical protein